MKHQHPKVELEPGTTRTMYVAGLWHEGEGQYGPYLGCQVNVQGQSGRHMLWVPPSLIQKIKDAALQEGDEITITTKGVPGKKGMRKEYQMRIEYIASQTKRREITSNEADEETTTQKASIEDPKIYEHVKIYKQCLAGSLEIWSENGLTPPPQQIGSTATAMYIQISALKAPKTLREMYEAVKMETQKVIAHLEGEEADSWKKTIEYIETLVKKCEIEKMVQQHHAA
jgi:hypothetical protein